MFVQPPATRGRPVEHRYINGFDMVTSFLVTLYLLVGAVTGQHMALNPADYREHFTEGWPGPFLNGSGVGVINVSSYEFAIQNLPLFECSDPDLTAAYYYRAKTYKSHLVSTDWVDIKHVSSEFGPTVHWGGVYGTINAAAGHHLSEGRWLRDSTYMEGLSRFWIGSQAPNPQASSGGVFEPGVGHFANGTRGESGSCPYSSWILTGALKAAAVKGDLKLGLDLHGSTVGFKELLPLMVGWWESRSLQLRVDCIISNGKTLGSDR